MIACKRGRISIAFILILLAVLYLALFMFPANLLGLVIQPEVNVMVMDNVVEELNAQNEAPVIVMLKEGFSAQSTISTLNENEFKPRYQYSIINAFSGNITAEGLERLRNSQEVQAVYLDEKNEFFLDKSAPLINATAVWNMQYNGVNITGKGISVCVIDSGINYSHPALAGKVIAGYNFVNTTEDFMDDLGHGTTVSGVIASNDSVYRGIAPDANLIAMKVGGSDSDIIAAIEWCLNNASKYNISVISMSIGYGIYSNQSECNAFPVSQEANKAKSKNVLVIAASGNEGDIYKNVMARPACASNVTSVSATLQDDSVWEKSETAKFLDLFAPGNVTSSNIRGGFSAGCGTSLSAPHVAGAAALIYQYEKLMGLNATPDEVEKVLKLGGKQIYDSDLGMSFPRINILNSINLIYKANISDNSFYNQNAKVKFNSYTDLTGIIDAFDISYNSISLNSVKYPQFNKSATLSLYNLSFSKNPVVLKNNQLCIDCSSISYSNGNFIFIVNSFTNYSAAANSELNIFDSSDSGSFFSGNTTIRANQTAFFYANYTNRTSGEIDNSSLCNITFADYQDLMHFNSTKNIFEYSRNFSSIGPNAYVINCISSGLEPLISSNSIWVSNCYPGPALNWTINESTGNMTCNSEILLINRTSILVQAGYELVLENTNIVLIEGDNKILINQTANFTARNSTIRAETASMTIDNYGTLNFDSVIFNGTTLNVMGNNTNFINNSEFYGSLTISFLQNSTTNIFNSNFSNDVSLGFSSGENPIVNFINGRFSGTESDLRLNYNSSITFVGNISLNSLYISSSGASIPKIFGNFTFSIFSINFAVAPTTKLFRYYPVQVRYSNSSTGIANKPINITDYLGNLVWNGTTDSNGFVQANLTLNRTSYGNGNFTISVNPSSNISLLTETPVIFELADSDAPVWSNNQTSPDSNSAYNPSQAYQFVVDWSDNVALSSVWFEHNFNGSMQNYSASNSGSTYYYNYQGLAAGTYQWRSYANDSSGKLNKTDLWNYIVNNASGQASLLLNDGAGNLDLVYGSQINASASTNYGALTLYRNDIPCAENNVYVLLGVGYYNYTAVSTGNQNYSQSSITRFANITQANSLLNLTLNNADSDISVDVNTNVDINTTLISPCSGTILLYLNNNLINNGSDSLKNSTSFPAAGTYNVTAYYSGDYNCSQTSQTHFITAQAASNGGSDGGSSGGGGGGGGGGGAAKNPVILPEYSEEQCIENWQCSEWTACIKGTQTRACSDLNNCGTSDSKPSEKQACEMPASVPIENSFKFSWKLILIFMFLIFIILLIWIVRENRLEILIRKAISAIKHKKYSRARKIYIKIHKIYIKLPDKKKRKYHERIEWIYHHLKR
jgi:hypothetical protein